MQIFERKRFFWGALIFHKLPYIYPCMNQKKWQNIWRCFFNLVKDKGFIFLSFYVEVGATSKPRQVYYSGFTWKQAFYRVHTSTVLNWSYPSRVVAIKLKALCLSSYFNYTGVGKNWYLHEIEHNDLTWDFHTGIY